MRIPISGRIIWSVVIAGLGAGYGLFDSQFRSTGNDPGASIWGLALEVATDFNFVAFGLLPTWLVYLVAYKPSTHSLPSQIRHGSHRAVFVSSIANSTRALALQITILSVTWLGLGFGQLVLGGGRGHGRFPAETFFIESGVPPLAAFVLQVGLILALFCTIRIVLEAVSLHARRPFVRVMLAGGIWMWCALSAGGTMIPSGSLVSFETYSNVGLLLRSPGLALATVAVLLAIAAGSILSVAALDWRVKGDYEIPTKTTAAFGAAIVLIGMVSIDMDVASLPISTALERVMAGANGSFIGVLVWIAIFGGYAYLFLLRIRGETGGWEHLILIRFGSQLRATKQIIVDESARIVSLFGFIGVCVVTWYLILGGNDFAEPISGWYVFLFQFLVNGSLQLLLLVVAVYCVTRILEQNIAGLIVVGCIAVIGAVPTEAPFSSPVYLSALRLASAGWPLVLSATLILLILTASTIAVTMYCLKFSPKWLQRKDEDERDLNHPNVKSVQKSSAF